VVLNHAQFVQEFHLRGVEIYLLQNFGILPRNYAVCYVVFFFFFLNGKYYSRRVNARSNETHGKNKSANIGATYIWNTYGKNQTPKSLLENDEAEIYKHMENQTEPDSNEYSCLTTPLSKRPKDTQPKNITASQS